MSFTGAKALEWKLKYIQAFNEMEKQIRTANLKDSKAGGLNGLVKTLNGVMKEEEVPAWQRAEVIKDVMAQCGIVLSDKFVKKPAFMQITLNIPID